ncbi:VanZ family protein [Bacillus sp. 2205SS5-2]|uniref:VanZ family protein n=1 Tax=Bacillus sp. 2205SS5-2 TaxID=3109031 RepID=UPI0030042E76
MMLAVFFAGILFVLTCSSNVSTFMDERAISFHVNSHPELLRFFSFQEFSLENPYYLSQKTGHILAFFLFTLVLKFAFKRLVVVIFISVTYAFFTEIAQLFFSRTGRLLDVIYDTTGIFLFIGFYLFYRFLERTLYRDSKHVQQTIKLPTSY